MLRVAAATMHRTPHHGDRLEPAIDRAHLARMTLGERSLEARGAGNCSTARPGFCCRAWTTRRPRPSRLSPTPSRARRADRRLVGGGRGRGGGRATDGTGPESLAEALARLAGALGEARAAIVRLLSPQ